MAQNAQLEQQNQGLVEQLVGIERLIDQHVAQSLSAHSTELRALYALTRDLHRHLTNDAEVGADCLWPPRASWRRIGGGLVAWLVTGDAMPDIPHPL